MAGRGVEPDEDRIAAVAQGYASQRVVGAAERALLPAAVRFGACYVGAIHLHQALAEGVRGASMDARLERLRNRVSVSEAVARLAVPHLAGSADLAEAQTRGRRGNGTLRPVACSRWARAHSSVVEHSPYKRGVTGSNPVAPTPRSSRFGGDHVHVSV